jgi:DNA repair protein RadC
MPTHPTARDAGVPYSAPAGASTAASRPRSARADAVARLATFGPDALGDVELLAIVTGGSMAATVAAFEGAGGLAALAAATPAEIAAAFGPARGAAVAAALVLSRRLAMCEVPYATGVRGPDDVARLARSMWGAEPSETFGVLGLDTRQRVRLVQRVAVGSIAQVDVHPREIFRPLVRAGMHAVILVHNHPSGEPDPSESDLELTRRLVDVGRVVGIPVLDHVVVTRTRSVSLAALGVING